MGTLRPIHLREHRLSKKRLNSAEKSDYLRKKKIKGVLAHSVDEFNQADAFNKLNLNIPEADALNG